MNSNPSEISNLRILGIGRVRGLQKLKLTTKNKVRAILRCEISDSLKVLNQLRVENTARELVQIDDALRDYAPSNNKIIPELFPSKPQFEEDFYRLDRLELSKEIEILEVLASEKQETLTVYFKKLSLVDRAIVDSRLQDAARLISDFTIEFGWSHLILRKAAVVDAMNDRYVLLSIDDLLEAAGKDRNRLIVSSLINCYKIEQDYFSLKKSILSLRHKGNSNKFTRDIARIPFQPLAKDPTDLVDLLQSARQSSLVDALVIAKANLDLLEINVPFNLKKLFATIDSNAIPIDEICKQYDDEKYDGEFNFYKHSSAWLEHTQIVQYRLLLDNFYDSQDSDYLSINPDLIRRIEPWVGDVTINALSTSANITAHPFPQLRVLEQAGSMTRSAIFNLRLYQTEGYEEIKERPLFSLMDLTRDLAKTSNIAYLGNAARMASTERAKLVLYFLIARKSKNEFDNHVLRRILQSVVIKEFKGSLVNFFDDLAEHSRAVSVFAYEVCTEDFIAKLFNIIHSTSEITETRAALHKWMGTFTGEKTYFDRARTLLIDHQLNKIRDEIDDNRIYVDAARFSEWVNDEIMRDLNSVLMGIEMKGALLDDSPDPQLVKLIELCYTTFCSNNIFGIASYLGRRIRHGTFKGQLYSSVIVIERVPKYRGFIEDPSVAPKWEKWKSSYQNEINQIIRERLHIESSGKRDGLLKPSQSSQSKVDIFSACARFLARNYYDLKSSAASVEIIIDYCWRLAEIDLKAINIYIKNKKPQLLNKDLLNEIRISAPYFYREVSNDFQRELLRSIDEKLMGMYNWFKRPLNVSPKASLSLLYRAVVAEVQEVFPEFSTSTDSVEEEDIELIGGAYHVIYDSLYVIVYNAAKHGKQGKSIDREFSLHLGGVAKKTLYLQLASTIRDDETDQYVKSRLTIHPDDDMTDAQVSEDRSGIRKLYHLSQITPGFRISELDCRNRRVIVTLSYALEH